MMTIFKLTTTSHWGDRKEEYYDSFEKVEKEIESFKEKIAEREVAFGAGKAYPYDIVDKWYVEEIKVR